MATFYIFQCDLYASFWFYSLVMHPYEVIVYFVSVFRFCKSGKILLILKLKNGTKGFAKFFWIFFLQNNKILPQNKILSLCLGCLLLEFKWNSMFLLMLCSSYFSRELLVPYFILKFFFASSRPVLLIFKPCSSNSNTILSCSRTFKLGSKTKFSFMYTLQTPQC